MVTVEKFSLLILVLAYMIIVMLWFMRSQNAVFLVYNNYFILEIILYISSNITNNLVSLLPPHSLISLS